MTKTERWRWRNKRIPKLALNYAKAMTGFLDRNEKLKAYRRTLHLISTSDSPDGHLAREVLLKFDL